MLKISCLETFKVSTGDGADVTPSSEKARAILILLALAPKGERRRVWLQDKLWSDKSHSRGSQSLRQALSDIRKSFGHHSNLLTADRRSVRLDGVTLDDPGNLNLTEAFDVGDIEFELWAQENATCTEKPWTTHAHQTAQSLQAQRPLRVTVVSLGDQSDYSNYLRRTLIDQISLCTSESTTPDTFLWSENDSDADLALEIESQIGKSNYGFRVTWRKHAGGHRLWSNARTIPIDSSCPVNPDGLLQLAYDASSGLLDHRRKNLSIFHGDRTLYSMALDAVSKMFTFDATLFPQADEVLSDACDAEANGLYWAWRSMLRNMQIVERLTSDVRTTQQEAEAFARIALELDPTNSLVAAVAANTFLITSNAIDLSLDLAQCAVKTNPSNPLAWDALGLVATHADNAAKANEYSMRAKFLGGSGFLKPWLDMTLCLTAVGQHDTETALRSAKMSHLLLPNFKPPLRYLTVLNSLEGRIEDAQKYSKLLGKLENDFSVERMIDDADYPLAAYRASQLPIRHLSIIA